MEEVTMKGVQKLSPIFKGVFVKALVNHSGFVQ